MKAITIEAWGETPALRDIETPVPGHGEVLVRVEASSINGFDLSVQSGMVKDAFPNELPITLGRDFAGVVDAVGSGVADLAVGDRVFGVNFKVFLGEPLHDGTFAEYTTAPAIFTAKIPDGVTSQVAGALGLAGSAAFAAVGAIAPAPGDTVLISGATGGVGAIAVQLAKARGATVIAMATPDRAEHVKSLGADESVDYNDDLAAAVLRTTPGGVDAIVHLGGDGQGLAAALKPGARLSSTLGYALDPSAFPDVEVIAVNASPTTAILDELAAAVAAGELVVPIEAAYPLADTATAFAEFAKGGRRGKLSIAIS